VSLHAASSTASGGGAVLAVVSGALGGAGFWLCGRRWLRLGVAGLCLVLFCVLLAALAALVALLLVVGCGCCQQLCVSWLLLDVPSAAWPPLWVGLSRGDGLAASRLAGVILLLPQ
jgi:hypothetical protein